jgi:hypothetical protein
MTSARIRAKRLHDPPQLKAVSNNHNDFKQLFRVRRDNCS